MGFQGSTGVNRLPTVDAPDLPHVPRMPIKPKFQIVVGYTSGDRGDHVTKKGANGVQEIVDRRGGSLHANDISEFRLRAL